MSVDKVRRLNPLVDRFDSRRRYQSEHLPRSSGFAWRIIVSRVAQCQWQILTWYFCGITLWPHRDTIL